MPTNLCVGSAVACMLVTPAFLLAAEPHELSTDPDARAAAIVSNMSLDEQIQLVNGGVGAAVNLPIMPPEVRNAKPEGAVGSAGFVRGIPRLGIPHLQETDGGQGVANGREKRKGDEATQLPSGLALASTFDPDIVRRSGQVLGREAHAKGLNVVLGGPLNIVREPRSGRNFESASEDPLLSGIIVGAMVAGTQSQNVVSTVKHYAMNSQETGRSVHNAVIDEAAMRESDLLAFQIGIAEGQPGSVMTAYTKVNGMNSTEHPFLLNTILKGEWGFKGWVMSDWGAVHSTVDAALAGLDQESGREFDKIVFFGEALKAAVQEGKVPPERLADMNRRIVRSLIATGAFDHPAVPNGAIDIHAHAEVAEQAALEGIVLLRNSGELLPLSRQTRRIAVIGGHADKGVLTGGGSAQVIPYGGVAYRDRRGDDSAAIATESIYAPSSPLAALRAEFPYAEFVFDEGRNVEQAAATARTADAAIVFAVKPSFEGIDSPDLSLPDEQDRLIEAVASANSRSIVILETGAPVLMPWLNRVSAVLAAWYPGQRGAEALAAILSGRVAPSGRLPVSFPRSTSQLPRPQLPGYKPGIGLDLAIGDRPAPFDIDYFEGSDVGYRWYERQRDTPLYPFGHGLTYTTFTYSDLSVETGPEGKLIASFTVANNGKQTGVSVPQLYIAPPGRTHRLAGWSRLSLGPGEKRKATIVADRRLLASFQKGQWIIAGGAYSAFVGPDAGSRALTHKVLMEAYVATPTAP